MPELCTHCGLGDTEPEGRRLLILCSACLAAGTHAGCHEDVTGQPLSPEITHGDGLYFCGQVCNLNRAEFEFREASTQRHENPPPRSNVFVLVRRWVPHMICSAHQYIEDVI